MGNKVGWVEFSGGDGKSLQKFYADFCGWTIDANNPMNYGMVDASESGVGTGVGPAGPDGASHLTVYIEVDDLQAALDKAESLGGKTVTPPMDIPDGPSIAHFSDPEGNFVGLMKPMGS